MTKHEKQDMVNRYMRKKVEEQIESGELEPVNLKWVRWFLFLVLLALIIVIGSSLS